MLSFGLKKNFYHFITKSRRNIFGMFLYSLCNSIFEALENKNNDFKTNGENWLINQLDPMDELVVFDVGANIGDWSRLVQARNNRALIHSFEPVPSVFQKLEQNVKDFDHIFPNNLALGKSLGSLTMNYYPNNSLFSSFYEHPMGRNLGKEVNVNVITGDYYCEKNNILQIDLLKIDVEGFESNVLLGFEKMILSKKIRMIQFEYGDLVLKSRFLLKDFYDLLQSSGYEIGKLFPDYIEFSPYSISKENFLTSNYIARLVES